MKIGNDHTFVSLIFFFGLCSHPPSRLPPPPLIPFKRKKNEYTTANYYIISNINFVCD